MSAERISGAKVKAQREGIPTEVVFYVPGQDHVVFVTVKIQCIAFYSAITIRIAKYYTI
jgi:hypothetical protein